MTRLVVMVLFVVAQVGCGSKERATCIEGQSAACACPSGETGSQTCEPKGKFGPCTCSGTSSLSAQGDSAGAASSGATAKCSVAALQCISFSTRGETGWDLHKRVFNARKAKRYGEAICLAVHSLNASDKVLAGASYFEAAKAWKGLGCEAKAAAAIELSLRVRPRGRSGWKETCDLCVELGMPCASCRIKPAVEPCPSALDAAALLTLTFATTKKVSVLKCSPGSFPEPGWAFVAWVGEPADLEHSAGEVGDGRASHLHHVILGTSGVIIADISAEAGWHQRNNAEETNTLRLEAVDFDGDGTDEVVEESEYVRRGYAIRTLDVLAVKGAKLVSAFSLETSFDDSGMASEAGDTTCAASWSISETANRAHELVVTSTQASGPGAMKCIVGSKRYSMRGGKLTAR